MAETDRQKNLNHPKVQSSQALVAETVALFHELRGLAQRVHGEDEATAARRGILRSLILGGPQTVPELARSRSLTRQSIQQVVNQLKEKGLVQSLPNQEHKRSFLIAPTPAGKEWFEQLAEREALFLVNQSLPLSSQEIWSLVVGLRKMREFFAQAGPLAPKTDPQKSSPTLEEP
ncbi:MAG: hypothetical protein A2600_10080 [Candidatus Lambdaproteobacteria bacterium RIFOXYD1_FULL_56_27]|uniref:HTH marR-type domain-containing protein n=1 Tax=Candidatus Lambdaproteobacteria bacterium RIFOXYD2_FULL_56_26 TaxID=1817773 RepID=A0A1F6H1W3_9PROT|nr:MAG: hypothetical protein A2426_12380 [Candidatus Lambdaproteobacteria bacterium RIFOXYC1_FULL_56_13]OGH04359.1 MAG: hypothetical protein A2557_10960 [Candidatus Lambdaproteobacteria bacterium RIFOXYD2_FULL_56_26]OGH08666.1 MAG: hypothetical protein A2600_10080 [Candidatus Lambdaproteobacteria bacterium RIFOXYD1_FULL_56_27]